MVQFFERIKQYAFDMYRVDLKTAAATVTIGGQNANVVYSIASPGFPGLYQVAVTMPSGVPPGNAPVILRMCPRNWLARETILSDAPSLSMSSEVPHDREIPAKIEYEGKFAPGPDAAVFAALDQARAAVVPA